MDRMGIACYHHDTNRLHEPEVRIMRVVLKILLFPVTLALSLVVALCRLACQLSGMVLGLLALVIFATGLGTMLLLQEVREGLGIMGLAFLVSPFGVPLIATFLVELLGIFNDSLKEI